MLTGIDPKGEYTNAEIDLLFRHISERTDFISLRAFTIWLESGLQPNYQPLLLLRPKLLGSLHNPLSPIERVPHLLKELVEEMRVFGPRYVYNVYRLHVQESVNTKLRGYNLADLTLNHLKHFLAAMGFDPIGEDMYDTISWLLENNYLYPHVVTGTQGEVETLVQSERLWKALINFISSAPLDPRPSLPGQSPHDIVNGMRAAILHKHLTALEQVQYVCEDRLLMIAPRPTTSTKRI
jgi:hypothetical protein